jgi:hypothetical protein
MTRDFEQALERLEELAKQVGRLEHLNAQLEMQNEQLERHKTSFGFVNTVLRDVRRLGEAYKTLHQELWKKRKDVGELSPVEQARSEMAAEIVLFMNYLERHFSRYVMEDDWSRWMVLEWRGSRWELMNPGCGLVDTDCPDRLSEIYSSAVPDWEEGLAEGRYAVVPYMAPPTPPPK